MNMIVQLLTVFLQIGLFSIGGGYAIIPLIQEQVVEKFGWVSQQVFTDIITISQMTPGPLAVNTSTFVGIQIAGIPGAVAATVGCVVSGVTISLILYKFFQDHKESVYAMEVLGGLKAASVGLILSAATTILMLTFFGTSVIGEIVSVDWLAVIVFTISLLVLRKWKLNPIFLMVCTGVIGYLIY